MIRKLSRIYKSFRKNIHVYEETHVLKKKKKRPFQMRKRVSKS